MDAAVETTLKAGKPAMLRKMRNLRIASNLLLGYRTYESRRNWSRCMDGRLAANQPARHMLRLFA